MNLNEAIQQINYVDKVRNILVKRDEFSREYSLEKGWDFKDLTIEQILEIRSQPEWKDPKQSGHSSV